MTFFGFIFRTACCQGGFFQRNEHTPCPVQCFALSWTVKSEYVPHKTVLLENITFFGPQKRSDFSTFVNNNTVLVLFTLLKKIFNYILITCRNNDHLFHYFYWHIHSIYWLISKDINKTHEWSVSGPCRLFFFRQNKNRFQLWVVDVTKHLCHSLDRIQWRKISHQRDKIIIQLQDEFQNKVIVILKGKEASLKLRNKTHRNY